MRAAQLLRTHLYDPVVLSRSFHHPAAFHDVMAGRLLHIYILARLARLDGDDGMPVVGSGHQHRVNVLAIQNAAIVPDGFGLPARKAAIGFRDLELVHVAKDGHSDSRQAGELLQNLAASPAATNDGQANGVVLVESAGAAPCQVRSGGDARRYVQKVPTMDLTRKHRSLSDQKTNFKPS